jgi:hypothetical protein
MTAPAATGTTASLQVSPPAAAPAPMAALSATTTVSSPLTFDKQPLESTVVAYGEQVTQQLFLTNTTRDTLLVDPYPPLTTIGGSLLSPALILLESDASLLIPARGTETYSVVWDQRNALGEQVAPGWYIIQFGGVRATTALGEEFGLAIGAMPPFLVQHPQGAMVRVFEPALTATVGETSVTLERVELTERGVAITALLKPAGYTPAAADEEDPVAGLLPGVVDYLIDGVIAQARYSELEAVAEGIRMIWYVTEPGPPPAPIPAPPPPAGIRQGRGYPRSCSSDSRRSGIAGG